MIDFSFSEEQQSLARTIRAFAERELLPNYSRWDRTETFPHELVPRMAEVGLTGLQVSERYGGQGLDHVSAGIAHYEVGRGDINCATIILVYTLAGRMIEAFASDEIKDEWLPQLTAGRRIIAVGLTEPHCGSDAAALKTRAVRDGGDYVLTGEKASSSLIAEADVAIVFAKTDPDVGARGVSGFVVPLDLPGVQKAPYDDMGSKGVKRGSLFLDGVRIPARNRIAEEGDGFRKIMNAFDFSRALIGLFALGAADITLEETTEYVKQRMAFGQPIARFEGVQFPIAEHATVLEAARWLAYKALWLRDRELPHTKEASMVKWFAPKAAVHCIHDCLLLHGHYGYTQDFPAEQRLRDVMGYELGDGTAQIQKIVIARELLGREYLPY